MSQALAINPDINLEEILRVSAGNDFDVVYSPLLKGPGGIQGGTFIKPAPVHEGASTTYDRPDALPGDVSVEQLKEFKNDFNRSRGKNQTGMSVLKKNDGEVVLTSYRSALYAEFADNGEAMTDSGVSLDAAIDKYVQETGDTLQLPSVY